MIDSNTPSEETENNWSEPENINSVTNMEYLGTDAEEIPEREEVNETANQENQLEVNSQNELSEVTVSSTFSLNEKETIDKSITIIDQNTESDTSNHSKNSGENSDHSEFSLKNSEHSELSIKSSDHSELSLKSSDHADANSWDTDEDDEEESIISIQCGLFIIILLCLILGICAKICYSKSVDDEKVKVEKIKLECEAELEKAKKSFIEVDTITQLENITSIFNEKCAWKPEEKTVIIAGEMAIAKKKICLEVFEATFVEATTKLAIDDIYNKHSEKCGNVFIDEIKSAMETAKSKIKPIKPNPKITPVNEELGTGTKELIQKIMTNNIPESVDIKPEENINIIPENEIDQEVPFRRGDYVFFHTKNSLPQAWKVGLVKTTGPLQIQSAMNTSDYIFSGKEIDFKPFKIEEDHYVYYYELDCWSNQIWHVAIVSSLTPTLAFTSANDEKTVNPDFDNVFSKKMVDPNAKQFPKSYRNIDFAYDYPLIRVKEAFSPFQKNAMIKGMGKSCCREQMIVNTQDRKWCCHIELSQNQYSRLEVIPELVPKKSKCCCHKHEKRGNDGCTWCMNLQILVGIVLTVLMYSIPVIMNTNGSFYYYVLCIVQGAVALLIILLFYTPYFKSRMPQPYTDCGITADCESPFCWVLIFSWHDKCNGNPIGFPICIVFWMFTWPIILVIDMWRCYAFNRYSN